MMKTNPTKSFRQRAKFGSRALALASSLLVGAVSVNAATIAHWTFEDGVNGQPFTPAEAANGSGGSVDVINGILMRGWSSTAGPSWTSATYGTGLGANMANGAQDGYVTEGALHNWSPSTWTIEMMVNLRSLSGWRTLIGRDGSSVSSAEADFYFQNNGINDQFRINYLAADGTRRVLDGNFAPQANKWYALAIVNDGATLSMYLDEGAGAGPTLIGSLDMSGQTPELNTLPATAATWTFGRGWYNGANVDFIDGAMDNVRFSDVALTPAQLQTLPTNVFVLNGPTPAVQTVAVGNSFNINVTAGGLNPVYQWRRGGVNISGASSPTYTVASASLSDIGSYDCVITNNFSAVTSSVAIVNLHSPRNLTWAGLGAAFDTTSAHWTTNNGGSFLAYIETDNIRFDPLGVAQSVVTNGAARQPSSVTVSNAAYTITGAAITSPALTVRDSATLTLSNANTFTTSTVNNGVLNLGAANSLGALTVSGSGLVQLQNGISQTVGSLAGNGLISSVSGAPVLNLGGNNANSTWSGTLTNAPGASLSFIKTGTGTNTFTGANYLAGTAASQVNGGGLILGPTGSLIGTSTAEFWVAQGATTGYAEINGGTLSVSNWLVIGRNSAAANGALVVNSGTLSKQGGGNIVVGSLGATGTLIVNGGTVLNNANLWLGENSGANATLRLNGGTVQATQIRVNGSGITTSSAFFNGGTLQAAASSADFIPTTTLALISAGGLTFDSNGYDVGINNVLAEDSVTPSAGGGLTKVGSGTLTLSGGSSYTGPTVVRGGVLELNNPGFSLSSPSIVVSNATLRLSAPAAGAIPANNVVLGNGAIIAIDYGTLFSNPGTPAIAASGSLTAPGTTVTISIAGNGLQVGTIPLITYTGATLPSLANIVLGPLPPGVNATLVNSPNSLNLQITSTGQNLSWYGDVNNLWNINNTANWANSLVPGAKYLEYGATGDPVRFDDTAAGNYNINLPVSVHPFIVVVDAANDYSITGAGSITGAAALVKSNTGTMFLGTANTYSGGTFVNSGTLAISNNTALGNATTPVTLGGGSLQLSQGTALPATRQVTVNAASTINVPTSATASVGGLITGAGAISKIGEGSLTISGSNNITGAMNANLGTLNFSGTNNATTAAPAYMGVGSALGSATLNLLPGSVITRFETKLGNQPGVKGTLNMTNASLTTGGGEIWIGGSGDNITTEGEMNVVNSSVTVNNWTAIGRSFGSGNSKGVLRLIGSTWTNQGANNFVVTSAAGNNGTVHVDATSTLVTGTGNQIWVGEGGNGVLNINGGTVLARRTANPAVAVGRAGVGAGSIRLNSGILDSADQTWIGNNNSSAALGSYGEMRMSGGTFISRWYLVVGGQNDFGVFSQSGGNTYVTNRFITVGAAAGSYGVYDLSGGTYTAFDAGGDGGIYVGESGTGVVTLRGTAQASVTGTTTGGGVRFGRTAGASGTLNLSGGLLTANRVAKTTATTLAILNFNGGTLKASMNNTGFLAGLDQAYVHPGGARIDDSGFAITIGQSLVSPTGSGVTGIAVASGGSGYIGAPVVIVSGGTGTNCTAVANMVDDGTGNGTFSVGSITITSPGVYTVDPTTVTFLGGGQNAAVATAGTITMAANASGGLTKLGSGVTTLTGANTYTGATVISNGTLNVNGTIAGAVTVRSGATLGGTGSIAGVVTVDNGAMLGAGTSIGTLTLGTAPVLGNSATVVVELDRTNAQPADLLVVSAGTLAYNGTLVLKNTGQALQVGDTFTVFTAPGYSGSFTIQSQTPGQTVTWNTANLAVNGTVTVATATPNTFNLNTAVTGNTLGLSWNTVGLRLETNAVSVANAGAWFTYPGSTSVTNVNLTIDPTKTNVFFRLVFP